MLYILNLYSAECQLYLHKTGENQIASITKLLSCQYCFSMITVTGIKIKINRVRGGAKMAA